MKGIYLLIAIAPIILWSCKKDEEKPATMEINSITIGSQVWMKKNLDVDHYRNGDVIPQVTDPSTWVRLTTGAWCYYNNDPEKGKIYGKLYNWFAVNDSRGLAPSGWHVPSDAEWNVLTEYLGGDNIAGEKMKDTGTNHWLFPNSDTTNSSGFTGLPGGQRDFGSDYGSGSFYHIGSVGNWWSSSEDDASYAWFRNLGYDRSYVYRGFSPKRNGFSVRCLKD